MNIKDLDPLKKEFLEFLNFLPIQQMEEDILNSGDQVALKAHDGTVYAKF